MKKYTTILGLFITTVAVSTAYSQEIPMGQWRLHPSYNSIHTIAAGPDEIYAAAETALMVLHDDNSTSVVTKLSGLTGSSISCLAWNTNTKQLVVGYSDGHLDLVSDDGIYNFNRIFESSDITGSKKINHISTKGSYAYLSTDFGVVMFDLALKEIRETWRDLGAGGSDITINQSAIRGDSIFLATSFGVQAGDLSDNLLDFALWRRYNSGAFAGPIQSIVGLDNDQLFACISGQGLYSYGVGEWLLEPHLFGSTFLTLGGTQHLTATTTAGVFRIASDNSLESISSPLITEANYATEDSFGNLLIGDSQNGMLRDDQGTLTSLVPNGPSQQILRRVVYHKGTLFALAGGYNPNMTPANRPGDVNQFSSGVWSAEKAVLNDLTDITFAGATQYLSSFGSGILQGTPSSPDALFDDQNSSLQTTASGVTVTSLTITAEGLWATNYGATNGLHVRRNGGSWQGYSTAVTAARYPLQAVPDFSGNIWMRLAASQGGGLWVFSPYTEQSAYLTNVAGTGGLPSRNVYSLCLDKGGYIWVGTDQGVGYFANPSSVLTNPSNLIRPIFESRYLLQTEKVTALAVDGGDRKWMGTENGLWLFGPAGETLVYSFTAVNSPLPSNVILDIAINDDTGEVFIATDKGLASFRSDASSGSDFSQVKIFPNPVRPGFSGVIGIQGLGEDAFVKITDVSGRLIFQTQANGGTATWNVRDMSGRHVTTGVYLVFSVAVDGSESFVGKVAVIE